MKKIALLTSNRADFSIYRPLIIRFESIKEVDLTVIAFGSHTSKEHGYTIDDINKYDLNEVIPIITSHSGDSKKSIVLSMSLTQKKLCEVWEKRNFDLILAVGDRYEMFAAVSSLVPFNKKIAHFHGGEKSLGSADNLYRHSISALSDIHFTTCDNHKKRVMQIVENERHDQVFNVGSLSLANIDINLFSVDEFKEKYQLDFNKKTILFTYHPNTIDSSLCEKELSLFFSIFEKIEGFQILITMPNNDAMGLFCRQMIIDFSKNNENIKVYDYLGSKGYFSAMNLCTMMLGNSSSGIIEAASFGCWVINVGDRQKGRERNSNVFDLDFDQRSIIKKIFQISKMKRFNGKNIYFQEDTLERVCKIILKS